MPGRGRPRKIIGARRYPNRLLELRGRLGLAQRQVAAAAGISLAYYGALERGDKRINADTAQRLQAALRCGAGELLSGAQPASVPLCFVVAGAESETRLGPYELPEPYEWLPSSRLAEPAGCFAAELVDDSADLDFAPGTILFVRRLAALAGPLRLGTKILARFFIDPQAAADARQTHEILYGVLDQNILGDLVLITRTRNRLLSRNPLIQAASAPAAGLAEAPLAMRRRDAAVEYAPRAGDPAEILGAVVYAAGPT
jgi:transcriptional regulator with XRE-family HTH domain